MFRDVNFNFIQYRYGELSLNDVLNRSRLPFKGKGLEPLLVIDLLGCSQEEYVSKFVFADFSYCVLIISTGITRHLYRLGSLILLE